jgi:enhancing lycopene biosynthesis protein 2
MGANHIPSHHGDVIFDEKYKPITSPCYMLDASISQIIDGVNASIDRLTALF